MTELLRRCFAAILSSSLALAVVSADAMDFSYQTFKFPASDVPDTPITFLVASGEIHDGDANRLREFLVANPMKFLDGAARGGAGGGVLLDSPGGDVDEAIRLAQVLRELLASTAIKSPNVCASACFFLYVGSAMRGLLTPPYVGIAIHRPSFSADITRQMSAREADAAHNAGFARAKRWLQDQLVPEELIDKMFSLSSQQAYWLNIHDKNTLGSRAPWYEEWLVARCPDYLKNEQRYLTTSSPDESRHLMNENIVCEKRQVWQEQECALERFGVASRCAKPGPIGKGTPACSAAEIEMEDTRCRQLQKLLTPGSR